MGEDATLMSPSPHSAGSESEGESAEHRHEAVPLKTLLVVNLRVLLIVSVLGAAAFALWRGLAALFPELKWLQYPG